MNASAESAERRAGDRVAIAAVMVVEDSPTTRRILRRWLERASYRVSEAADGREALGRCRADPPDLMLLDVDMPIMDGPALLARLRVEDGLGEIPVILLTARTKAEDAAAGLRLGAQDFVRKPCAEVELQARVAAVLSRQSERRTLLETAYQADQLSLVDSLTGLANRRQFARRRDHLIATEGERTSVGVIVLDVDHFKRVNDDEGHLAGDAVLRILARRLQMTIEPADLLVRWGGEEFLVLAPGLDAAQTAALADRLHAIVGAAPFAIDGHEPLAITVSVGWVCGVLPATDGLIPVADQALYEAKRTGRDRVVSAARAQS